VEVPRNGVAASNEGATPDASSGAAEAKWSVRVRGFGAVSPGGRGVEGIMKWAEGARCEGDPPALRELASAGGLRRALRKLGAAAW
jgi:hypothetical protein